jgi:hypothetical protein
MTPGLLLTAAGSARLFGGAQDADDTVVKDADDRGDFFGLVTARSAG